MPSFRNREDTDNISTFQDIEQDISLPLTDTEPQGTYETIWNWQKDVAADVFPVGSPPEFERFIEIPEHPTQSDYSEETRTIHGSVPSLDTASTAASPVLDEPDMARQLMPRQQDSNDNIQEMFLPSAGFASQTPSNMSFQFESPPEQHHVSCPRFALQYMQQHDPSCPAHNISFPQVYSQPSGFHNGMGTQLSLGGQMPHFPIMQATQPFYGPPTSQAMLAAAHFDDAVQPMQTFARMPTPSASSAANEPSFLSGDTHIDSESIVRTASPATKSEVSTTVRSRVSHKSSDPSQGRNSHLYNAQPREDGLYHCHFEGDESCSHAPTNLKCNYDKFIDSHLKPYRCSKKGCEDLHFSSTACRLRHERETHGSHGHGNKPFPCKFTDCERHENGFPRHWNCVDHMKRVHGYDPDVDKEDAAEADGKATSTTSSSHTVKSSKKRPRKESSVPAAAVGKKQKTGSDAKNKASSSFMHDVEENQQLHNQWRELRTQLRECVTKLGGPTDKDTLQQLMQKVQRLSEINEILST